jgi:dTMP kinase
VLCDRFTDATYAYQSGGSGVEWQKIQILEKWAQGELQPDLTLYFDVDPEVGRRRAGAVRAPDRYEQERAEFHERVRAAYLRRAAEASVRVRIIDANQDLANVHKQLEDALVRFCREK